MQEQGFLQTLEGWKLLMSRYLHLNRIPIIILKLDDMASQGIAPDLDMYKIIVDGLIAMNYYDAYVMASFYCWREFILHYPLMKPDVEFLNKMIYCCRKVKDANRAFYFIAVMHQCKITPVLETFQELLQVSKYACCHQNSLWEKGHKSSNIVYSNLSLVFVLLNCLLTLKTMKQKF